MSQVNAHACMKAFIWRTVITMIYEMECKFMKKKYLAVFMAALMAVSMFVYASASEAGYQPPAGSVVNNTGADDPIVQEPIEEPTQEPAAVPTPAATVAPLPTTVPAAPESKATEAPKTEKKSETKKDETKKEETKKEETKKEDAAATATEEPLNEAALEEGGSTANIDVVPAEVIPTQEPDTEPVVNEEPLQNANVETGAIIPGLFVAKGISGCSVLTSSSEIRSNYMVTDQGIPYVKVVDLDSDKYPVSAKNLKLLCDSQAAELGPMVNMEIGQLVGGSFVNLSEGGAPIKVCFGIPLSFMKDGASYAVVGMRKDGTSYVWTDEDNQPETVSFSTTGGIGNYAIIRY